MAYVDDALPPKRERRSGRIEVGFYAELRGGTGVLHRCYVTSLRTRGCYVEGLCGPDDFPDGKCWVNLNLPDCAHPLPLVGEVLRGEGGVVYKGLAIRFVAMARGTRHALDRWIAVEMAG